MSYLITYTDEAGKTYDHEKMTLEAAENFASEILNCSTDAGRIISSSIEVFVW